MLRNDFPCCEKTIKVILKIFVFTQKKYNDAKAQQEQQIFFSVC